MTALHPNTDLVAVAWLKTVPGIDPGQVATSLPQDTSTWTEAGFVQVTTVGGTPHLDVPLAQPVVQVDCWAAGASSGNPPWGKANQLAELIRTACYAAAFHTQDLLATLPAAYNNARVLSAYLLSEPRRINDDPSSYARYQFDLQIHWVEVPK